METAAEMMGSVRDCFFESGLFFVNRCTESIQHLGVRIIFLDCGPKVHRSKK
jgi:hypothetical protein